MNVASVFARVVAELQGVAARASFGMSGDEVLAVLVASLRVVSGAGAWGIRMRDGIPWLMPPRWRDPDRVPLRNTTHEHYERARTAGRKLRLRLDEYTPRQ